jgi:hypothetical protein
MSSPPRSHAALKQGHMSTTTSCPSWPFTTPGDEPRYFHVKSHSDSSPFSRTTQEEITEAVSHATLNEQAEQAIAPFLKKHIPDQYGALGSTRPQHQSHTDKSNTKFCYRHRPDIKCRRQANEPSMEHLQKVGSTALSTSRLANALLRSLGTSHSQTSKGFHTHGRCSLQRLRHNAS